MEKKHLLIWRRKIFVINPYVEKMEKFQNQLKVLMHRMDLQEVGVTRPYPLEWESTCFLEGYKSLKLESYDRKGSPNQNIY